MTASHLDARDTEGCVCVVACYVPAASLLSAVTDGRGQADHDDPGAWGFHRAEFP